MPRQNYFPTDEGFSSTLLRHGTETPTEERARRLNFDAETLAIEQAITDRMSQLVEMKRQEVDTAMKQKAIQQSAAVLPLLNEIDPQAEDYDEQIQSIFRGNSYARVNPAVESLLETQREARKKMGELNLRATEAAAAKAEKQRANNDEIRGSVAKLGTSYLQQFDDDVKTSADPISAFARVSSKVESSQLRDQLLSAGISEDEIVALQGDDGVIDRSKARQVIAGLVSQDAFKAAGSIIDDVLKTRGTVPLDEFLNTLPPEELDQYREAKRTQMDYIRQLNRRGKSKPAPSAEAPVFDKEFTYKGNTRTP